MDELAAAAWGQVGKSFLSPFLLYIERVIATSYKRPFPPPGASRRLALPLRSMGWDVHLLSVKILPPTRIVAH